MLSFAGCVGCGLLDSKIWRAITIFHEILAGNHKSLYVYNLKYFIVSRFNKFCGLIIQVVTIVSKALWRI